MMNNILELREKLIVSAHIKIEDAIPSLSQIIGYRQRVAQEIMSETSDIKLKELWEMWNYSTSQICAILGL